MSRRLFNELLKLAVHEKTENQFAPLDEMYVAGLLFIRSICFRYQLPVKRI